MTKYTENSVGVDRRKFITGAGVVGVTGLAGCLGDDDEEDEELIDEGNGADDDNGVDDDSVDADDSDDSLDDESVLYIGSDGPQDPEQFQFNLLNDNTMSDTTSYTYDALAYYNSNTDELDPMIASNWGFNDDIFTIELYEGHKWQNGNQITADDIVSQFRLQGHLGDPMWELIDEVEAVDDLTIELTKSDPNISEGIVEAQVLAAPDRVNIRNIYMNPDVYGEYLEQLEDATTDQEEDEVIVELNELTVENSDDVGSGPFRYVEHDATTFQLELFDEYENQYVSADEIDIKTIEAYQHRSDRSENMTLWSEETIESGEVNGDTEFYEDCCFNEDWFETPSYHEGFGHGVAFNMNDPIYGLREVRQAITYVVDKEAAATHAPYHKPQMADVTDKLVGLTNPNTERYIDDPDVFRSYESTPENIETAEALMEDAGFHREDDMWEGEVNGETLEGVFKAPPWWEPHSVSVVDDLQDFGLPIELEAMEGATFTSDYEAGDWRIAIQEWGRGTHPWLSWSVQGGFSVDAQRGVRFPDEVEVPMPIGDPEGDMESIAVREKLEELQMSEGDEESELIMELAWVWNWTCPFAQLFDFNQMRGYRTDNWNFPPADDPVAGNWDSVSSAIKFGEVNANTE